AGDGEPDRDDRVARQVRRGDHGGDARGVPGRGDVERADLAVRGRGPDDPRVQLSRGAEVVAEPAAPAQQPRVLCSGQAGTDGSHFRRARAVATMASMMPW